MSKKKGLSQKDKLHLAGVERQNRMQQLMQQQQNQQMQRMQNPYMKLNKWSNPLSQQMQNSQWNNITFSKMLKEEGKHRHIAYPVQCERCAGDDDDCWDCSGTGIGPIPFPEVIKGIREKF